jgi:hypothetical protein
MLRNFSRFAVVPPRRWLVALLAVLVAFNLGYILGNQASCQRSSASLDISAPSNSGYKDVLAAQPRLMAEATAALNPRRKNRSQIFVVSIAAGGSQAIFGREAEAVRDLFARRLGKPASSLLLSNAAVHLDKVPMANRDNLSAGLAAIGQRFDPASDTALIFLTAHGAPDSTLQTDLPNAFGLKPIDAPFLAEQLNKAGIARRIVIVSACFSGTWIPPLASPDTIVITASSATRTSFGCDDRRQHTFFGTALLGGPLAQGSSLREAYDRLQIDIGAEESRLQLEPSIPMYSVGTRMQGFWNAPIAGTGKR